MIRTAAGALAGAFLVLIAFAVLVWAQPVHAADCGIASWYGSAHQGKTMANGRPFNRHAMTAASWRYPLGTVVTVRSVASGKEIRVTIADRGPAKRLNRVVDLSEAAFAKLAPIGQGIVRVCVEPL